MEIRQLQCFFETAKSNSFTKAAEKLYIAQPAVSMAIKKLEKELGITLFHRHDRAVRLTVEGERFLIHVQKIFDQLEEARLEMEELRGLERGEVKLGLPSMMGSFYFPNIIVAFKKAYPHLNISIIEDGTKQIQANIENDTIDLGVIILDETTKELESIPIINEEMVVCVPATHKLAQGKSITYEQLAGEALVLFKEGYFQRDIVINHIQDLGLVPNIAFETNQISLTKSLTRKGLGVTLFLKMVIQDDKDFVPLSLTPPITLSLGLAWKKRTYLSKANEAFVDFVRNEKWVL
ncbi:LysR family transcriptional regulator [Anaerobacillus sp. CMMVII]|uniref:LysR family transcriptional regulator n=1 Tax=Anaerobacillus sp. CMMVII TaxID=2755588 RepID=UPI0021B7C6BC|nr:LysR family transcriptional regulator [Anaerobacillus sp. CMMVII]MCT8138230.1 LysR family transcriptional regulator [Anaerobacillus sp. CMMVII]